jgi:hypothetical protein
MLSSSTRVLPAPLVTAAVQRRSYCASGVLCSVPRFEHSARASLARQGQRQGEADAEAQAKFDAINAQGYGRHIIAAREKQREQFLALSEEDRVRQFMVSQRRFDVDLVIRTGLNPQEEFQRYTAAIRDINKKATRSFWGPMATSTFGIAVCLYGLFAFWY